jgi:hypothetical protein
MRLRESMYRVSGITRRPARSRLRLVAARRRHLAAQHAVTPSGPASEAGVRAGGCLPACLPACLLCNAMTVQYSTYTVGEASGAAGRATTPGQIKTLNKTIKHYQETTPARQPPCKCSHRLPSAAPALRLVRAPRPRPWTNSLARPHHVHTTTHHRDHVVQGAAAQRCGEEH